MAILHYIAIQFKCICVEPKSKVLPFASGCSPDAGRTPGGCRAGAGYCFHFITHYKSILTDNFIEKTLSILLRTVCIVNTMKGQFDETAAYCRLLGHYVPFKYCRSMNHDLPCRKIKDCWFEKMDIEVYINENYTKSDQERIFTPPSEKITTILDLIKKSREN